MGAFKVDARCFIYFFSKLFLDPVEFLEIQNVNVNFIYISDIKLSTIINVAILLLLSFLIRVSHTSFLYMRL